MPFYLCGQSADLRVDVGLLDLEGTANWMRVRRLAFTVGDGPAPAGYQLALFQIRAGVARRNSFGPLSERQLATMAELRERFFPDHSEEQLLPRSEPLPG